MASYSIENVSHLSTRQLLSLIRQLKENSELEAVGKRLSLDQFLELLTQLRKETNLATKLSPLLVGLSPYIFFQALHLMPMSSVEVLKREGVLEPLQHQLNLFIHECELVNRQAMELVHALTVEIQGSHISDWDHHDLESMLLKIEQIRDYYDEIIKAINKALALTWNTNRIDLLDKLNHLKESTFNQMQKVGTPRHESGPPTGLFNILENFLHNTYGSAEAAQEDIEALLDDDSAIEGLAKFSIWYLNDYWELGLLPNITSVEELELDPVRYNERERVQHRQQLFNQVQQNLNKLGIGLVGDLKKAEIFSKKMLIEYINKYRKKILH